MVDEADNPLDDELLRELGLEPTPKPKAPKPKALARSMVPPRTPVPQEEQSKDDPDTELAPREEIPAASQAEFKQGTKDLTQNLPIPVIAVLGKKTMTLKEIMELKQGEFIEFQKLPQDTIDLVANGKLVARGSLVLVDGKLGIQIRQLAG